MHITSLYSNIPQVECINKVCTEYENFLERCLPHSKALARESTWTKLIQSHEQKYLQTNRTAMVAKTQIFNKSANKSLVYLENKYFLMSLRSGEA